MLIALSGARNRTEGHFLACPKPWVMGHCPCKRGTPYVSTEESQREVLLKAAGEGMPLAEVTTYLLGRGILLFLQFSWMLESFSAPQVQRLSCAAGSVCFRLLVGSSNSWPPWHPLLRPRWERLGQFIYGHFVLSELLGEAGGLC